MAGQGIKFIKGPNAGGSGHTIAALDNAVSIDAALWHWLEQLNLGTGDSDFIDTPPGSQLWATRVDRTDSGEAGSTYVVSDTCLRRIHARRYP